MLSDADQRVLAHLRNHGACSATSVGHACFREAGAPRHAATLPAAAHLSRMCERGLVHRLGRLYEISDEGVSPDLFGPH